MIYNFISSQSIIAKVMSDLDIQNVGQRTTDMVEWIGEAMEKIGAMQQYEYKQSGLDDTPVLKIVNFQTALPSDLHAIEEIAYSSHENGPWVPMRTNTSSFKGHPDAYDVNVPVNTEVFETTSYWPLMTIKRGNRNMTDYSAAPRYFLKPGYIVTTCKDGFIKLAYKAIHVDCDGYPMVPDLDSYQEAIYWYVTMKLKYPEFSSGRMNENRYFDIRNQWSYYRKQAYGDAMMPTASDMISIKNQWLQLIPDVNAEQTFYSTINEPQTIYSYYGKRY